MKMHVARMFVVCVVVLLGLTNCSRGTSSAPDNPLHGGGLLSGRAEEARYWQRTTNEVSTMSFDFYIQATSYMAGFAGQEESAFGDIMRTLSNISMPWTIDRSARRSFFRIDVTNMIYDQHRPYQISAFQFENDAPHLPGFHCVSWYFEQDGGQTARFEQAFNEPFQFHYRNFLSDTIREHIDRSHVSVFITDMLDNGFDAERLSEQLISIIDDSNMAVVLFAFQLPFDGIVYNGTRPLGNDIDHGNWQPITYQGERPLYALIIGCVAAVTSYSMAVNEELTTLNVPHQYAFFNRCNKVNAVFNLVEDSLISAGNIINSGDLPDGVQRLQRVEQPASDELQEGDVLYFNINRRDTHYQYVHLDLALPFELPDLWDIRNLDFSLDLAVWSVDRPGDSSDYHHWVQVPPDRIMDGLFYNSGVSLSAGREMLNVQLRINREELGRLCPFPTSRYAIVITVNAYKETIAPVWVDRFAYSGSPVMVSDPSAFGQYTMSLRDVVRMLSLRAGMYEQNPSVAANIIVYITF